MYNTGCSCNAGLINEVIAGIYVTPGQGNKMLQNEHHNDGGKTLEYQTLEVHITVTRLRGVDLNADRRNEVEYDANGTPYSSPATQSNFIVNTEVERSVYPEYYGNSSYNPGELNVGGKHEFSPLPYPVSQQPQLWQVGQTNPNLEVLPATQYLPQHDHKVANHLCWSILVMFFCCWPLGLVAISKSGQARFLAEIGNYAEAKEKANSAKTYIMTAFIIGLLFYCVFGAIMFYRFYKLQ